MNLANLFQLQENLDNRITKEHGLHGETLLSKKVLALQVELAELANETRCFKFWSNRKPSDRETILEEYVDCLHFILTLGLEKGFTDIQLEDKELQFDLTTQFLNLYIDINDFVVCSSKDHYITLFEDFLTLGKMFDFTIEEVEAFYYIKNNINHKRQDEGY
jgi:dimeric dUTPase (all-alpha-NTP-PPase superfamily)